MHCQQKIRVNDCLSQHSNDLSHQPMHCSRGVVVKIMRMMNRMMMMMFMEH